MPDKMTWAQWLKEAKRAGEYYWAYADFVDDNPDGAKAAFERGDNPYEYIKQEGQRLDLHEFGPAWGGW